MPVVCNCSIGVSTVVEATVICIGSAFSADFASTETGIGAVYSTDFIVAVAIGVIVATEDSKEVGEARMMAGAFTMIGCGFVKAVAMVCGAVPCVAVVCDCFGAFATCIGVVPSVGMAIAVVVTTAFGITVEAIASGVFNASKEVGEARMMAGTFAMIGCGSAKVVAMTCGAGICAVVVSVGIGVAVAVCFGTAVEA